MLRTNYERQAAIQRLLNEREETEINSFIHEDPSKREESELNQSTNSKENKYDIPAEVILSQTTKAKKSNNWTEMTQNMQR